MRSLIFVAFLVFLFVTATAMPSRAQEVSSRAQKLHKRAIVVDTHIDVTQRLLFEKDFDIAKRDAKGHVDIPRMREGGLD
ncbi:MAG TPA: hypothetical protein VGQ11_00845, partial [Candidatus Acidoferrales bacterium]|nr:hypothetical protein [Candidatus Acidoferrales bacterium]